MCTYCIRRQRKTDQNSELDRARQMSGFKTNGVLANQGVFHSGYIEGFLQNCGKYTDIIYTYLSKAASNEEVLSIRFPAYNTQIANYRHAGPDVVHAV